MKQYRIDKELADVFKILIGKQVPLKLTRMQYLIVVALHEGWTMTQKELNQKCNFKKDTNLTVHIYRLRKEKFSGEDVIQNKYGSGYCLNQKYFQKVLCILNGKTKWKKYEIVSLIFL
jgi:DNA-binding response OmpR family regulator